jgi:EpsI family protein
MTNRNYISILFLLIITIFLSWGFYFYAYKHQDTINIKDFPLTVDDWTSQDLPINKADLAIIETKNVFLRQYTNKAQKSVYLYIAYSQSNLNASNPPEVIYRNSDISILDKGKKYIIIASSNLNFKVNWLVLDNNQNQQIVYYWFKVGDVYTQSYWKEQALAAFNSLSGKKTGNALIRISTDIVNGQQEQAINLINEFSCLIIPQLFKHLP